MTTKEQRFKADFEKASQWYSDYIDQLPGLDDDEQVYQKLYYYGFPDKYKEDPMAAPFYLLRHAKDPLRALVLSTFTKPVFEQVIGKIPTEVRTSAYHIIACIEVWNQQWNWAEESQHEFLNDENWCTQYHNLIETYLVMIMAQKENRFINNIIEKYPYIKAQHKELFDTYPLLFQERVHPDDKNDLYSKLMLCQINYFDG